MKYLLDTNICIYLINGEEALKKKVRDIGVFSLSTSNATLAELYFGAYKSKNVYANLERVHTFKKNLTVYSDSAASAEAFGRFKSRLWFEGRIIEDFDILIASIAFVNNCMRLSEKYPNFY